MELQSISRRLCWKVSHLKKKKLWVPISRQRKTFTCLLCIPLKLILAHTCYYFLITLWINQQPWRSSVNISTIPKTKAMKKLWCLPTTFAFLSTKQGERVFLWSTLRWPLCTNAKSRVWVLVILQDIFYMHIHVEKINGSTPKPRHSGTFK